MKSENFIIIQGWMLTHLKLKGPELLLYATLYSFGQARCGFLPTKEELRNFVESYIVQASFYRSFNSLFQKELITVIEGRIAACIPEYQFEKKDSQSEKIGSQNDNTPNNININQREEHPAPIRKSQFSDPHELAKRLFGNPLGQ